MTLPDKEQLTWQEDTAFAKLIKETLTERFNNAHRFTRFPDVNDIEEEDIGIIRQLLDELWGDRLSPETLEDTFRFLVSEYKKDWRAEFEA